MPTVSQVSKGDQNRALALSTIAFTACFAVWTIFSIIGVAIKKELSLTEFQFGLGSHPDPDRIAYPAVPGVWTETRYGGRLVFSADDPCGSGNLAR